MSEHEAPVSARNPWKLATYILVGCIVATLAAGVVIAKRGDGGLETAPATLAASEASAVPAAEPEKAPAPAEAAAEPAEAPKATASSSRSETRTPVARASTRPTASDVEYCNRYASSRRNKTVETAKNALVGGALGAALGAAGGAIADGGSGAGKGAAIGGLVGVAGGTAYGINKNNQADTAARAAYESCLERRGYF